MRAQDWREKRLAVAGACTTIQTPMLGPLLARIRARHGAAIMAIVYYGSCLRSGDPSHGLADFYVIVDSYRGARQSIASAVANTLLPPNVYYAACTAGGTTLRCKYALLTRAQLAAGATRWFQASIWGRFAQPVAIVYARSAVDADYIRALCGAAVASLLARALPAIAPGASPEQTFSAALRLSYASELRVERTDRSTEMVAQHAAEYARRLRQALPLLGMAVIVDADERVRFYPSRRQRLWARVAWPLRRLQGKLLSILRLAKACFTFTDAVDYAAFKIEKHTGVAICVTDRLRRHPLLFGWAALWRLYRQRRLR